MIEFILAIWICISIWAQIRGKLSLKKRFYGFVPNNRLFSPKPVSHDYEILYKDVLSDSWLKYNVPKKNRFSLLWCPSIRVTKSIGTIVRHLMKIKDNETVMISYPYLRILNLINMKAKERNISKVQFMICLSKGFQDNRHEYVFISEEHKVS